MLLWLLGAADEAFAVDVDVVLLGSGLLPYLRLIDSHRTGPDAALQTEALLINRVARLRYDAFFQGHFDTVVDLVLDLLRLIRARIDHGATFLIWIEVVRP